MLITCLSGFSFHARKWKIKDRRKLHDKRLAKSGQLFTTMLNLVADKIEDPGPYAGSCGFKAGEKPDFKHVSLGDIMDALVQVRRASADEMVFAEPCARCSKMLHVEFNLSELSRHKPSEIGLEHLQSDKPISITISDTTLGEVEVFVRALRGSDMPTITKWASSTDQEPGLAEDVLNCLHIEEIRSQSGSAKVIRGLQDVLEFWGDQDFHVQDELAEAIEDFTGGIDTEIEEECPHCDVENQLSVPFDLRFFYPARPTGRRRRNSISSMRLG